MKLFLLIVLRSFTSIGGLDINDDFSRTIIVDSNFTIRTCTNKFDWHCPNISEAFRRLVDNTRIIIKDNQVLSENQTLKNVNGLLITGLMDDISLTCIKNNIGIIVEHCTNILFTRIQIKKCGMIKAVEGELLSAALHLSYVKNTYFLKVRFIGNVGYATVMSESEEEAKFNQVVVESNSIPTGIRSGGGVLIIQKKSSARASISFKDCIFRFNSGDSNYLQSKANSIIFGAGLSVAFRGLSKKNMLTISSCQFLDNTGIFGAGLFLIFTEFSDNNLVLVKNTSFMKNRAVLEGGGFKLYNSITDSNINNRVDFKNCNFSYNHAVFGGASSQISKIIKMNISYTNCIFYCNNGTLGKSIYGENFNLVFSSINVSENLLSPQNLPSFVGYAALFARYCRIYFQNYNYIKLISNTAIVLDMSNVIVNGELHLWNNSGIKGAAIALFEHSGIHVTKNATMTVLNCMAYKGGAIYVELTGPFGKSVLIKDLLGYNCFMNIETINNVIFKNNTSLQDGENDIFVTTLKNCVKSVKSLSMLQQRFGTHLIVTNPIKLKLNSMDWEGKYPGELFKPSLFLIDELSNYISTVVDVVVDNSGVCYSLFVTNNSIEFELKGEPSAAFIVTVYFENIFVNLHGRRKYCPFAYSYSKDKNECICSNAVNREKGMFCNIDGSVSLLNGMYVNISEIGVVHDKETTYTCPQGYCKPCEQFSCKLNTSDSNQQCNFGRHGYLCSMCPSNMTVALGSEQCLPKCSDYNWLWLFIFFTAIFVLTCLCMIFLNVCIYENWMNSFIYFYQVLPLHLSKKVFNKSPSLRALTGIITFNGLQQNKMTDGFCIFKNWNNLDKTFFNYFFPVCLFISLIIISNISCLHLKLVKISNKIQRVRNPNVEPENTHLLQVFTVILIFTYADITRISLALLQPVRFPGEPDRPYVYAVNQYGEKIHGFYILVAVLCILLIVIGFPLLLMTNVWKRWGFFKEIARQHGMLESFRGKFADNFRMFVSFFFFSQLLIISLSKTARDEIITLTSIVLFVTFGTCFPFKDQATNYFDSFLLFLLALVAILRDGTFPILNDNLYYKLINVLDCVTLSLVFLPCLIVPIRWVFRFKKHPRAPHNAIDLEEEPILKNEDVTSTIQVQWTE